MNKEDDEFLDNLTDGLIPNGRCTTHHNACACRTAQVLSLIAKLQTRLDAAEKVCREAEEWHWGTHHSKCPFEECLTCQALDNWRRVKEGK